METDCPWVAKDAHTVAVECIIPILRVENLPASIQYYVEVLGFGVDWGSEAGSEMASVSRNGCSIMLCQGGQDPPGSWIWIGVGDIEPLFEILRFGSEPSMILDPHLRLHRCR